MESSLATQFQTRTAERRVEQAAKRGVTVLPFSVGGVTVFGVYRDGRTVARCTLFDDAAEVAHALALYRPS